MNEVAARVRHDGEECEAGAAGTRRPLPAGSTGVDGLAVHSGVRPGGLLFAPHGPGIPAQEVVVEPRGTGTEPLVKAGDTQRVVVIRSGTGVRPADTVCLAIDIDVGHVFDPATGPRLG